MKVKSIEYPTPLSMVEDLENDSVDVFVELEDGYKYTLVVTTPKNYYWYMDKEGLDFIPSSPPDIIVRQLDEEIIKKAIEDFAEDPYWLKWYYLAGNDSENMTKHLDDLMEKIKNRYLDMDGEY